MIIQLPLLHYKMRVYSKGIRGKTTFYNKSVPTSVTPGIWTVKGTVPLPAKEKLLMNDFDLSDTWCIRNPPAWQYVFLRGDQASRIDLWLLSNHLVDKCLQLTILPMPTSDHALLSLKIVPTNSPEDQDFCFSTLNSSTTGNMYHRFLTPTSVSPGTKHRGPDA